MTACGQSRPKSSDTAVQAGGSDQPTTADRRPAGADFLTTQALPEKLKKLPADWVYASLSVRGLATKGHGMSGGAMFVINPPWKLKAALEESLPWLAQVLALDEKVAWGVEASDPGAAKPRGD